MAVDDEPEPPLIDLGERPPADTAPGDAPAPPVRTGRPRWHLTLGAVGFLAVGFVGGIAVQRAAAPGPVPSKSASPIASYTRVWVYPAPTSGCGQMYQSRRGNQIKVARICTGTVRAITGARVTLALGGGETVVFSVDSRTEFRGVSSLRALRVGQVVEARVEDQTSEGSRATAVLVH